MRCREVTLEENIGRRNYQVADNIDYLDGDKESSIYFDQEEEGTVYEYGGPSLINDNVRVYKGGKLNDRVYWVIPGTRRFLEEDQEQLHHRSALRHDACSISAGNAMGDN